MEYLDYTYKHNYIEFSSSIYKVGTYTYNLEILDLGDFLYIYYLYIF